MEGHYQKPFDAASDLQVFVNLISKAFSHPPLDPSIPDSPVLGSLSTNSGDLAMYPKSLWSGSSIKTITNIGTYVHQEEVIPEQSVSWSLFFLLPKFPPHSLPLRNAGGVVCCDQHNQGNPKVMELRIHFVSEKYSQVYLCSPPLSAYRRQLQGRNTCL